MAELDRKVLIPDDFDAGILLSPCEDCRAKSAGVATEI
jgi:hypothetical protein